MVRFEVGFMSYTVTLPYDPVWSALYWAQEHCPSYITNQNQSRSGSTFSNRQYDIVYYFGEERDAVLFALRWA